MKMLYGIAIALLMLVFGTALAVETGSSDTYPPLNAGGGDISVSTEVKSFSFDELGPTFVEPLDYARPDAMENAPEMARPLGPGYRYTLTIRNSSSVRIQLSLADKELMDSPIAAIAQSFTLALEPGASVEISFVAFGKPKEVPVWMRGAAFDAKRQKWIFGGVGALASVYLPPFNAPFILSSYYVKP